MRNQSKFFVFRDVNRSRWDRRLFAEAERQRLSCEVIVEPEQIGRAVNCVAFSHLTHKPRLRERTKRDHLNAETRGAVIIPTRNETLVYDDKVKQFESFSQFLPKTLYLTSQTKAVAAINELGFPFVSKASQGAASSNIRLISNRKEALAEVTAVFDGSGLRCRHRQRQRGYLLWQEFLSGNANDWRVLILFRRFGLVLKRYNRPNVPFASGSGVFESGRCLEELAPYLTFAREFAVGKGFEFCGVDLLWDHGKEQLKLLETTTGWSMSGYRKCRWYEWNNGEWRDTRLDGDSMFELIVGWTQSELSRFSGHSEN